MVWVVAGVAAYGFFHERMKNKRRITAFETALIGECGVFSTALMVGSVANKRETACQLAKSAGVYNAYLANTIFTDYDDLLDYLLSEVRAVKYANSRCVGIFANTNVSIKATLSSTNHEEGKYNGSIAPTGYRGGSDHGSFRFCRHPAGGKAHAERAQFDGKPDAE
jgi:hypothetical protein